MTLQVFYLNNGSSDTPVDYSGQGSDGTKSGTITSSSTSVFYDGLIQILFGSGAYIDSGHTFSHDNDFTLVFYGSAMSQTNTYLYSADQFDLQFDGSNQMVFTMTNDAAGTQTITTSGGINKNSGVIMVIASWDVSTKEMTLYIDDSKQTATASGAFTTSDTNARIGADTAGANNYSSLMSVFMGFDTYITNDMATKLFAVCNRKRIYIKCSDTSATVDDSGYDVGLTLSNITGGGSIVTGKSYVFNGTSSYITIDALDSLDTFRDFSFQCWVNFDTKVTDQFLVDMGYQQNGGFGVYYDTSVDQLKAVMTNMAGTDTEVNILSVVKTGVWYFISVTWDWSSKTLSTYIDAKIINQTTCSGEYAFLNYSVDVEIGRQSGGSAYFDGNLVEIRLENNLFNSTDINDYYHLRGNGNYYSKIHTDFKFSGDYLDSSGLNNHLTASGGNSYDFTRSNVRSGQGLEINSKTDYLEVTNYKYRFFEKDIIAFSFTGYDLYDSGGTIGGTVFGDAYIGGDYTGRFHFRNSTNSSVAIYGSAFFTEDTLGSTFGFISYNLNSTNIRFVYAEVDFINNSGEVWVDNTSIGTFNFNKNVAVPYEERDFRIGYLESNERGLLRGTLDRLTIYSQPLTSSQRKEAYQYSEYYDLRIKNRSVFWRITSMSFTNSINFQSGDFDAVLYNKYLEFDDLLERGSDVKIYQDGVLVWFGSLEEPLFGKNRMIRLIGRHYFNILFQRRASIDYSGSAASRASIMGTLITNKLSSAQGKIHFNNSGVQTINSNTITPVITEEFVGNIFLRFAKQENAVVFLEMDSSYADGSSAIPIN